MLEDRKRLAAASATYQGGVVAPRATKRAMEIEDLLRWAFRDELPKDRGLVGEAPLGFGKAWGSIERWSETMATIDNARLNAWGVVPLAAAFRPDDRPHRDALAVGNAVMDLDGLVLDLDADFAPLAEFGDMGGHLGAVMDRVVARISDVGADGVRRLNLRAREIVFSHAVTGGCPAWEAEAPEVKIECHGANGKPKWFVRRVVVVDGVTIEQEVDGWNARGKRPLPDAYQKTYLDPCPVEAAIGRARYEIWRTALDVLVEDLMPVLEAHAVRASRRPLRPWLRCEPAGRVLPALG